LEHVANNGSALATLKETLEVVIPPDASVSHPYAHILIWRNMNNVMVSAQDTFTIKLHFSTGVE
jgi:hypothetical protein